MCVTGLNGELEDAKELQVSSGTDVQNAKPAFSPLQGNKNSSFCSEASGRIFQVTVRD